VIDYDFYVNSYLGSAIPEKSFSGVALRAMDALAAIRRRYQVAATDEVSEKMALCAMAETLYSHSGRKAGVASASVGGVSVRYENGSLTKELLQKAKIYLEIYRGAAV
jgi:hypothetical protein